MEAFKELSKNSIVDEYIAKVKGKSMASGKNYDKMTKVQGKRRRKIDKFRRKSENPTNFVENPTKFFRK